MESGLAVVAGDFFRPHFFGLPKSSPCLRPPCIKGDVGDDFRDFGAGDAVLLGLLQVVSERRVGHALADERGEGDDASVAQAKEVVAAPHLAKENVIVEMSKLWGKLAQLRAACRLDYLFLCHNVRFQQTFSRHGKFEQTRLCSSGLTKTLRLIVANNTIRNNLIISMRFWRFLNWLEQIVCE